MTAKIIDGNLLSKELRSHVAERAAVLTSKGQQPGLAVILVGDSPASQVYVRNKIKACEDVGIHSVFEKYDAKLTEAELLARVEALNHDPRIHGILVQLPLPPHIDSFKVIEAIAAEKDVDGFHVNNAGLLMTGQPLFRPCTPYGVMKNDLHPNRNHLLPTSYFHRFLSFENKSFKTKNVLVELFNRIVLSIYNQRSSN